MINKMSPIALAVTSLFALNASPVIAQESVKYKKDEILVVYKENVSIFERLSAQNLVAGTVTDKNADGIDDKFKYLLSGRLAKLSLKSGSNVESAIKLISKHPAVKYAEPNYTYTAIGMPDDPNFLELWGLNNTGQTGGVSGADIDAVTAWDTTTGSENVVIGVIDTGVDYNHPDLVANLWVNPNEIPGNGIDDDNNGVIDDVNGFNAITGTGDPMDGNGHGTHVSGTIGAQGNDGVGVVGVNWDVTIIGCKFLSDSGTGSTEAAIACIDYFTNLKVNHGVDVKATNNSWGGGGFSQALKDSIESAGDEGILFVAAAGNSAVDNDANPHYPSSYDSDVVLSIASTDHNDDMSSFSQWGLTSVDMGAPGSAILSTLPGNSYGTYSGTSMATPHITGAAALVWSIAPDIDPVTMKQLLMDSGDANAALTGLTVAGTRLNVANALADADPDPSFALSVTPSSQSVEAGSAVSYDFSLGSIAGWDDQVALSFDVSPALEGISLSANTAVVGDSFTLDVATLESAIWGDYVITVHADDGITSKSKAVSLEVYPAGLNDFGYSNDTPVDISDNTTITSTIEIGDELQIFGLDVNVDITHTWIGDLVVTLTSPNGTEAMLHNQTGGSADDIVQTWATEQFNGEIALGTWTLTVSDLAGGDSGSLNHWGLLLSALGDASPTAPVAGFEYAIDGLTVDFTDLSSDVNDDIVSYEWSFGDGSTSSDMNPTYAYAAGGIYSVTLVVTDSEGLTDTTAMDIEVFDYSIDAAVTRTMVSRRGSAAVDLSWSGANGESVNIYRDDVMVSTTSNDGRYRDRFTNAPAEVTYKICETDTTLCSDPIVAIF
ncbi:S8 family serine peptidase [Shewanella sp. 10N.286.52.B9]|uniref:S8 family serine peptidase n=1 Tax=Shewanella sp. 10N.286.52.B9 TaxID=1880837 RepID=UPI000C843DDF|nr:S8 family serine peptidase [Shewanella sp. 10N.286.52.B9]PMG51530.1 peptidase S8 [Shewanella sp. 10N.286.52.B9]